MDFNDIAPERLKPFTDEVEGAVKLPTTGLEAGVTYRHNIEYANINGTSLHLMIKMEKK